MIRKALLLTVVFTSLPAAAFADSFSFHVSVSSGYREPVVVHREPVVVVREPVVVVREPVVVRTVHEVRPAPVRVVTYEPVRVERTVVHTYKPIKHSKHDKYGKHYRDDKHHKKNTPTWHRPAPKPTVVCYDRPVYRHHGR